MLDIKINLNRNVSLKKLQISQERDHIYILQKPDGSHEILGLLKYCQTLLKVKSFLLLKTEKKIHIFLTMTHLMILFPTFFYNLSEQCLVELQRNQIDLCYRFCLGVIQIYFQIVNNKISQKARLNGVVCQSFRVGEQKLLCLLPLVIANKVISVLLCKRGDVMKLYLFSINNYCFPQNVL